MAKTDDELRDDILDTFNVLKDKRTELESIWKETDALFSTRVYNWNDVTDSKASMPKRYTSRPSQFLNVLANGIIGYSVSPNITWMKLQLSKNDMMDFYGVKDWLENCEKVLYAEFNRSNLYSEVYNFAHDAAEFGAAAMLIEEDLQSNRLRFSTRKLREIFLDINEFGSVDTVYRMFGMTVRNMVAFFGKENCHRNIQRLYDDRTSRAQVIKVLHAVYPRKERDTSKVDKKNMPYASTFIDLDNNFLIKDEGYYQNPYAVFVYDRVPESAYGESACEKAYSDVKYLNLSKEEMLKIAQLAARPPMNVPTSMRGQENVVPGGFNYYEDATQIMQPINTGVNFPITLEVMREIEQSIKDSMHVDFFLTLQAQAGGNKTATEVMELQGEKAAILSTLITNINLALQQIIERSFALLFMQGKIPQPPKVLADVDTQFIVDFVGPLAQAQKRFHQSGGVNQSMSIAAPVMQMFPEASDFIDGDELVLNILDSNGFPQGAIRERDDVKKMRLQRQEAQAQAAQQQMALQQQQALLQNMDKVNKPIQQGSPLQQLNDQLKEGLGNA